MVDKLADTWHWRELPLLREVARRLDRGETNLSVSALAQQLNIDAGQAQIAIEALYDDGYLDGMLVEEIRGPVVVQSISPKARRELGLWPSPETGADRIIAALDALIAQAPTQDERTRLERIRDGLAVAGKDLAVSIAAAVITGQLPSQSG